ncbi:Histone H1, partial [Lucilia cuprina]
LQRSLREKSKKAAGATKAPKKIQRTTPLHHPTNGRIAAIKTLKERGGSSLPAIKKYLTSTYKKILKSAVTSGKLSKLKVRVASGSFKLSAAATKEPKAKKPAAEKKKAAVGAGEKKKK